LIQHLSKSLISMRSELKQILWDRPFMNTRRAAQSLALPSSPLCSKALFLISTPAIIARLLNAMPWIIDYPVVLEQMRQQHFKSLYYNSGAFGFPAEAEAQIVGWTGPEDSTLRAEARQMAQRISEPYEQNLARLLVQAAREQLMGRVWLMPMSHWSYELDFGSREWMPALLETIGVDPGLLSHRNNAAAIEFGPDEHAPLEHFVTVLLQMLQQSDFAIVFPRRPVIVTLHHHKQLWWQTSDGELAQTLRDLPAGGLSRQT
jgi:hypothetical protein